jgi:Protein of unknown function (DUF664)
MVHVIVDIRRHAGHADIIREIIDGTAGLLEGSGNLPSVDETWWASYHDKLQRWPRKPAETEPSPAS